MVKREFICAGHFVCLFVYFGLQTRIMDENKNFHYSCGKTIIVFLFNWVRILENQEIVGKSEFYMKLENILKIQLLSLGIHIHIIKYINYDISHTEGTLSQFFYFHRPFFVLIKFISDHDKSA